MTDPTSDSERAAALRGKLADDLVAKGTIVSKEVEAAFRTVPRHLFAPEATLEAAYAQAIVVTKRDEHGTTISSVSAPGIQAMMLEQAGLRPGMRVLEIGSGGYNAALIAELVGEHGEVTTVDIDPEVVTRARDCLATAGYPRVRVALADAELGVPEHAPYDRIIVTVGAWDIPPAWTDQLASGGRVIVPLRARGLTRSVVLEDEGGHLTSRGYELCGFVPMQGAGENRVRLAVLHDEKDEEVGLRLDDGQQADIDRLRAALTQPRAEAWPGVTIGGSVPFSDLDLWLATALPHYALLVGTRKARERGIVATASPLGTSTLIDGGSFAYRVGRPVPGEEDLYEFGAYAHGPDAEKAAHRLVEEIRTWDREHRADHATYRVYPADTPGDRLPAGLVLAKRHRIVTISWSAPDSRSEARNCASRSAGQREVREGSRGTSGKQPSDRADARQDLAKVKNQRKTITCGDALEPTTTLTVMNAETTDETAHATVLREKLLEQLRERGDVLSDRVAAAFATVPRHHFLPGASLEEAYVNDAVVTKRNDRGHAVSSVSAPWVQAQMLELSRLGPGMRALEIGSGGYNAALMSELVGEHGEVVSVDIDPEVVGRARRLLAESGYGNVRVVCGDGTYGAGDLAPDGGFDAVLVTAQAPDIPPAWSGQLAARGRLVVPLSFRGIHQIFAFAREEGHLRSRGQTRCGFVGMQGDNRHGGRTLDLLGGDLRLGLNDDQQADAESLRAAVASSARSTVWTGVVLRGSEGVLPSLDLYLVSTLVPCARIYASSRAVERGLSGWTIAAAATWEAGSIAFTTIRPDAGSGADAFELGVHAYGPDRDLLAARLADGIRAWDSGGHRGSVEPTVRAYPAATPDDQLASGQVITNRYSRLVISLL
ncbi:methyltransferase, FxLD system [Streptomyces sp. B1866]|uniref:methyltransferase, FxLD system n=1 Tax=Streptomyces sp. B1866 TaxID=3075431 RepID=UPI0028903AF2|nr:methyltransferase, FxLD system [Streptomyces sp. B1866]MDT3395296.1 methyltransferase, FxLD system [Streptomyces sp. B1866]